MDAYVCWFCLTFFSILPKQTCGRPPGTQAEMSTRKSCCYSPLGTVGTNDVCWMNRDNNKCMHKWGNEALPMSTTHNHNLDGQRCSDFLLRVDRWNVMTPRSVSAKTAHLCVHPLCSWRQKPQMSYHNSGKPTLLLFGTRTEPIQNCWDWNPLTTWGLTHSYNTSVSIHPHPSLLEDGDGIGKGHPPQEEAGVPFSNANLPRYLCLPS